MIAFREITAEINAVLENMGGPRSCPDVLFVTDRVLGNHPDIAGDDADWYVCCTYRAVRHEARQCINRLRDPGTETNEQLTLEGFQHLQLFYQVRRDDHVETVPIEAMEKEELYAKAHEYGAMSKTCAEHSDELIRYAELKFGGDFHPPPPGPQPQLPF